MSVIGSLVVSLLCIALSSGGGGVPNMYGGNPHDCPAKYPQCPQQNNTALSCRSNDCCPDRMLCDARDHKCWPCFKCGRFPTHMQGWCGRWGLCMGGQQKPALCNSFTLTKPNCTMTCTYEKDFVGKTCCITCPASHNTEEELQRNDDRGHITEMIHCRMYSPTGSEAYIGTSGNECWIPEVPGVEITELGYDTNPNCPAYKKPEERYLTPTRKEPVSEVTSTTTAVPVTRVPTPSKIDYRLIWGLTALSFTVAFIIVAVTVHRFFCSAGRKLCNHNPSLHTRTAPRRDPEEGHEVDDDGYSNVTEPQASTSSTSTETHDETQDNSSTSYSYSEEDAHNNNPSPGQQPTEDTSSETGSMHDVPRTPPRPVPSEHEIVPETSGPQPGEHTDSSGLGQSMTSNNTSSIYSNLHNSYSNLHNSLRDSLRRISRTLSNSLQLNLILYQPPPRTSSETHVKQRHSPGPCQHETERERMLSEPDVRGEVRTSDEGIGVDNEDDECDTPLKQRVPLPTQHVDIVMVRQQGRTQSSLSLPATYESSRE